MQCKTGFHLNNLITFFFYHTIRNPKSRFYCLALLCLSSSRYAHIGDIFQVCLLNMLICQALCVQFKYTYLDNIIIVYLQPVDSTTSLMFSGLWSRKRVSATSSSIVVTARTPKYISHLKVTVMALRLRRDLYTSNGRLLAMFSFKHL